MSNILQIAYTAEGHTDERFLGNIIEKTFEHLLFEGDTEIEIYTPVHVTKKGKSFNEKIKAIATSYSFFHIICIHCDSDSRLKNTVLKHKINPAFQLVYETENACKNLVAIIPVQMTEAWMLADIDLLLGEINTNKSCTELNLPCRTNQIENIANPKIQIENALHKAQINVTRRRGKLKIASLYSPMSRKLTIQKLNKISSFRDFMEDARQALIRLNYLR